MEQKVTIKMIEEKEFKIKAKGYDQEEVDVFLDEICDEMERLLKTISELQQNLREMQAQAQAQKKAEPVMGAPAPGATAAQTSDDVREILEMAQQIKNQTIADAQKKAEQIVADAQAKVEQQLGDLTAQRDRLADEVDALKDQAADFRVRLLDVLDSQKAALDKLGF